MTVDKDKDAAEKALEASEAYKVWRASTEAYHAVGKALDAATYAGYKATDVHKAWVDAVDAADKACNAAWLSMESSDVWRAYVVAYEKSKKRG